MLLFLAGGLTKFVFFGISINFFDLSRSCYLGFFVRAGLHRAGVRQVCG
jgi:hypothetical protein